MNSLKLSSFVVAILLFSISCSKTEDPVSTDFIINQSILDIQELDRVDFSVASTNAATNISTIQWFIDNTSIVNSLGFQHKFNDFGSFVIKANIQYYNDAGVLETAEVTKNITVTERPKYKVKVNTIEVLAYKQFDFFIYNSATRCSLKSYFELFEKDEFGGTSIKHTSTENTNNLDVPSPNDFQPMLWDISNINYEVTVYQMDNLFPNDQGFYHFQMINYGLNGVIGTTFDQINEHYFDLNPYRDTRPTGITFNTIHMTIKLTVEWN